MALRHQLAAYSPVGLRSIIAGARSLVARQDEGEVLCTILRDEYAADQVTLVDSGTHALQHALRQATAHTGRDAVVALPAFSCFDVATAAVGADVKVVVYDVDPATLGPDHASVEHVLKKGVQVIVIAHLYGMPVDWDVIAGLASKYGALLIEDAAQGHGASWNGKVLGSLGEISTLSFSRGKGWTGGRGGALLQRGDASPNLAASGMRPASLFKEMTSVAELAAQWVLGRPALYGIPRMIPALGLGETRYHAPASVRSIAGPAASALVASHDAATREGVVRRRMGQMLRERLAATRQLRTITPAIGADPGYLRFPIRIDGGIRGLRRPEAAVRSGIAPSYPQPIAELPEVASRLAWSMATPGATILARDLVTLPTHSWQTARDVETMLDLIGSV